MGEAALVIESQNLARDTLCEFLRTEGFDVQGAANVVDGVALIGNVRFDVVLCEVIHPHAEGFRTLERLREVAPDSRLIAMIPYVTAETIDTIMRLGAHYVQKPILFEELMAAIRPTSRG